MLLLAVAGWLGYRALQLQRGAEASRADLKRVEAAIRASDFPTADADLRSAARHAAQSRKAGQDPLWRLCGHLPGIGSSFRVASGVATALSTVTDQGLPGVLSTAREVDPRRTIKGTTVDLVPFSNAGPTLTRSAHVLAGAVSDVAALPDDGIGPVGTARTRLLAQLRPLSDTISAAAVGARVIPAMLGADGPRRYFLAVQNSAESRATGGLIGAFGIFSANAGTVNLDRTGVNDELKNFDRPVIDLGPEFDSRYRRLAADRVWLNANLSPDFPATGKIVSALWSKGEGQDLDGVLAIDPRGLSYLLEATGPVTMPDGAVITSGNVVQATLAGFYQRFRSPDQASRNEYMKETMRAAYDRVKNGKVNPAAMAERLGRAVLEGHLQLWAKDPAIEAELSQTRITGELPTDAVGFLQVVTQNTAGDKLDYYLRRTISYSGRLTGRSVDVGHGTQPEESGFITVTLTNNAPPSGLPDYVSVRNDLPPGTPHPVGQDKVWVSVYIGAGGQLVAADVDGKARAMTSEVEKGLSVFSTEVTIDPAGGTTTLRLQVFQPVSLDRPLLYRAQPMAFNEKVTINQAS